MSGPSWAPWLECSKRSVTVADSQSVIEAKARLWDAVAELSQAGAMWGRIQSEVGGRPRAEIAELHESIYLSFGLVAQGLRSNGYINVPDGGDSGVVCDWLMDKCEEVLKEVAKDA